MKKYEIDAIEGQMREHTDGVAYYLASEVDAEMATIKRDAERGKGAMRELERLTPQGSEFHNDPEFCAKYVREAWDNDRALMKKMALKRNQIREAAAARNAMILELIRYVDRDPFDNVFAESFGTAQKDEMLDRARALAEGKG